MPTSPRASAFPSTRSAGCWASPQPSRGCTRPHRPAAPGGTWTFANSLPVPPSGCLSWFLARSSPPATPTPPRATARSVAPPSSAMPQLPSASTSSRAAPSPPRSSRPPARTRERRHPPAPLPALLRRHGPRYRPARRRARRPQRRPRLPRTRTQSQPRPCPGPRQRLRRSPHQPGR